MKKIIFFVVLLASGFAYAETGDQAYTAAHECYVNLRSDANAQKLREPWEKCIKQFENVKKKYRREKAGADAQYSLGKLYEELASNSKNQADWKRAVKEYEAFALGYSRNKMADDAYFQAACIEWERFKDKDAAKADLMKVIKHYKDGDRAGEAKKYLDAMEKGKEPGETAAKEKAIVVVIDPGHGGKDTGAIGPDGLEEKDLTLAIAKNTAQELKDRIGSVQVFLTRETDKTLDLGQRVKFANKKKADYFISIHANASKSKKDHGIQTYYLNNASDEASERLASQENKYAGGKSSDIEKIIATMLQNEATDGSRDLARSVH